MEVVIPNTAALALLDEMTDTGNLFDGAKLHLFQDAPAITPEIVIGDLVECDFTGYATSSAIVWGAAHYLPTDLSPVVNGDVKPFTTGDPATLLNTVKGWYVTDGAGTVLLAARQFDAEIILSGPSQGFGVLPTVPASAVY